MKSLTINELALPDDVHVRTIVSVWLSRGDGIAVYENRDMSHPEVGHRIFISYGSNAAQLETEEPPVRLPDFPGQINWRYQLVGTYRQPTLQETA